MGHYTEMMGKGNSDSYPQGTWHPTDHTNMTDYLGRSGFERLLERNLWLMAYDQRGETCHPTPSAIWLLSRKNGYQCSPTEMTVLQHHPANPYGRLHF